MRRIAAVACCMLWLAYGNLSRLAHIHATSTPDQLHGLGLDHAHDSHGHEPIEDDHSHELGWAVGTPGAHHDGPVYMTPNAVRPDAKLIVVPVDPAGEALMAPQAPSETEPLDGDQQPRDPPSKRPPGLRAPPA